MTSDQRQDWPGCEDPRLCSILHWLYGLQIVTAARWDGQQLKVRSIYNIRPHSFYHAGWSCYLEIGKQKVELRINYN